MEVERLAGDVIEAVHFQPGLLANLADGRLLRAFTVLDPAMHRLPRRGAPGAERPLEREHEPLSAVRAHHVHIDYSNTEICHLCKLSAISHQPSARTAVIRQRTHFDVSPSGLMADGYVFSFSSALSRALSARGRKGFVRKSFAPVSKTRTSFSSSLFAVNTMTGSLAVEGRARRWFNTP